MNFAVVWGYIREKFPPSRVVAFVYAPLIPVIAVFNGWLADHLPFIAEQVGPDQVTAIVIGSLAALTGLGYKWLDGRSKWETTQVTARVALAQADKIGDELVVEALEPPPRSRRREREHRTQSRHRSLEPLPGPPDPPRPPDDRPVG